MPYWRLSGYYFFYFASLGVLVPYWGPYLKDQGFDALAIGQFMAILSATKVVAPMLWGQLVDRSGRRMPAVRLAALLAVLAFWPVFFVHSFWPMVLIMVLFSFFWNAALPQIEAVTFNHLKHRSSRYALVRLWGSVGFIFVVTVVGWLLERYGHFSVVPMWVLGLFGGLWLMTLMIPDNAPVADSHASVDLRTMLRRPEVIAFLCACLLMQFSHGTYYAFYSIHLEAAGYARSSIGWLWALGVVAEVGVFLMMQQLLERFGSRQVMLASLALAALRWLLIGAWIDLLAVQIFAQILHAASFGAFHAAAIQWVHHAFRGRTQGRGQAIYNSVSFGVGGALGSLIGGLMWTPCGPFWTFFVAAMASACGWFIAWRWVGADPDSSSSSSRAG